MGEIIEPTTKINQFEGKYRFLSNFWHSPIEFEGLRYPTVEHAFQAAKTIFQDERRKIKEAETPGKAKRLGRHVNLRPDWEKIKMDVMRNLLALKFDAHSDLKERLIETGDVELAEGNNWGDITWGVDLETGKGENRLGKLLMDLRSMYQSERK